MDLTAASAFMTTNARLLDRQRFVLAAGSVDPAADLTTGRGRPGAVLAALAGYRNDDGGFGWGLEPDLRSPESQPGAALHAFEVLAEVAPVTSDLAEPLCDWLGSVTLPDGGLPFALPVTESAGTSHWWRQADSTASSLHITAAVAGMAHRAARLDPAVARHEWLGLATDYCWRHIADLDRPHAMELRFVLDFLDAVHEVKPEADAVVRRLAALIPTDVVLPVEGGVEGEALHLLDLSPEPGRPLRELLSPAAVAADLDRLAGLQQEDGGWTVDFASSSDAGALEWRGYQTVWAVQILRAHGRLDPPAAT